MANYVTFEQAKWLKEKRYNEDCFVVFDNNEFKIFNPYISKNSQLIISACSAPEQHQVVDWLLKHHEIFVEVFRQRGINGHNFNFMCVSTKPGENHSTPIPIEREEGYETPQEAYSAAFDYIKNNDLI